MTTLSERIKALQERTKLPWEKIAAGIGVSQFTLIRWRSENPPELSPVSELKLSEYERKLSEAAQ